jgi:hypothetical protein
MTNEYVIGRKPLGIASEFFHFRQARYGRIPAV